MSVTLDQALAALEDFRAKMREHYQNDRRTMTELLRQLPRGKAPKKATAFMASLGYDEILFNWDQGSRSPSTRFTLSQGHIPKDPAVFQSMNLSFDHFTELNSVILTDLVVDAWIEADGLHQASRPLAIWRTLIDSREVEPEILKSLRATIQRLTDRLNDRANAPIAEEARPAIRPEQNVACHNAEPLALQNWAHSLLEEGFPQAAAGLHWFEEYRNRIAKSAATWMNVGQGMMVFRDHNNTWWSLGEEGNSVPGDGNPDSQHWQQVLDSWNDLFPAIEWFFRTLGYTQVSVHAHYPRDATLALSATYHFAHGDHLVPLPAQASVTEIHALTPWVPENLPAEN
jgi:hypothetical protein